MARFFFFFSNIFYILEYVISFLLIILSSAFLSLVERNLVALLQRRVGPSIVGGSFGIIQPIIDGFKLIFKETTSPNKSSKLVFLLSPLYSLGIGLCIFSCIVLDVYDWPLLENKYSVFAFIVLLSISQFGLLIAAIYSTNKFSIIGAIRSIAVSMSYGLSLTLIFLLPCFYTGTLNFKDIMEAQCEIPNIVPLLPAAITFWTVLLTEVKKIPFDVGEAETELASGYLIEYSSVNFAILVISEYLTISVLLLTFNILFLGGLYTFGYSSILLFAVKHVILVFIYLIFRSILPNFRFDEIMELHWKYVFTFKLLNVIIILGMY